MEQMTKIEEAIKKFFNEANENDELKKLTPSNLKILVLKGEEMAPDIKEKLTAKKWKVSKEGDCYYLS